MNPLLLIGGAAVAVFVLARPSKPVSKRQLAAEWQKSGGRDCGGWDPSYDDRQAWAQCDPKTIPRSVRRRLKRR